MADLTAIFHHLQRQLFPALTAELGALSALDQPFCEVISLTELGRFTHRYAWCGNGAPPCPRTWLAHAFIAKHVYQFPTTSALLDALKSRPLLRQLCGWDSAGEIPSEPTFSRAFKQFADDQFPVSAVLTSASVHDSQVAIPLAQLTAQRVTSLYDLMDSAYDAPQIHAFSRALGHGPIIDPNPRGGEKLPLAPAQAQRFKERSASERVNSLLKERYGGRWVRVRGAAKVMCHLMFGLVALTATALFARLG